MRCLGLVAEVAVDVQLVAGVLLRLAPQLRELDLQLPAVSNVTEVLRAIDTCTVLRTLRLRRGYSFRSKARKVGAENYHFRQLSGLQVRHAAGAVRWRQCLDTYKRDATTTEQGL